MAWASVRRFTTTKKSQWNNLVNALNQEHSADGVHKRANFLERVRCPRPHVMDTNPATTVSLIAAGEDRAFACGATTQTQVYWDYVPINTHVNASAGITVQVFFSAQAAEGTTVRVRVNVFRWRQGANPAQAALGVADVHYQIGAVGGHSVTFYDTASISQGDMIAVKFFRRGNIGSDTYSGDIYVTDAQLEYTYQV